MNHTPTAHLAADSALVRNLPMDMRAAPVVKADADAEIRVARSAVEAATHAQRLYGTSGIFAVQARAEARDAIYRALKAGATERDILPQLT